MKVRFVTDAVLSDGFTPTQYKGGEVYDLSAPSLRNALEYALHNGIAVELKDVDVAKPSESKVVTPSSSKVTRPSKLKSKD
jgi:hypothetical protein